MNVQYVFYLLSAILPPMYAAADKTRNTILHAAKKLFVKQGFAATSISQIATRAKINQSLIYHHFGNKEQLWQEVKQAIMQKADNSMQGFLAKLKEGAQAFTSAKAFFIQYLELRFQAYTKSADLVRMLQWQALEPKKTTLQGTQDLSWELFESVVKEFQISEQITSELSAKEILFFINQLISTQMVTNMQSKQYTQAEKERYFALIKAIVLDRFIK